MAGRNPLAGRHTTIGLLGGSFNPAHAGHRTISIMALNMLKLDAVWWLISPQNPLKFAQQPRPLNERLAYAKAVARHPRIHVETIEAHLPSRYTIDTVKYLKKRFPYTHFIWIMGADNLVQFSLWHRWREIVRLIPIAVYDRDHHMYRGLSGKMAACYKQNRLLGRNIHAIGTRSAPAWGVIRMRKHPLSSTWLRENSSL